MRFDTKNLNPGTWFYFDENKPDDGGISIRVLNTRKLAQIRDETIKTEAEYRNGTRHEYQVIDHARRDNLIWDYCIVDWQNLETDEGDPIECTTENKLMLMNEHVGFANFVEQCLSKLNEAVGIAEEDSEKN